MINVFLAILIALCYSVAYTILGPMTAAQDIRFDRSCILPFIICFCVCFAMNFLIFSIWSGGLGKGRGKLSRLFDKTGDRKLLLIVWAVIFLSWLPAFLVLYPGVLSYDMISQVGSAMEGITNNHHPVLHTWLIGRFMRLGKRIFGNYEAGIGLLSLTQMVLLSYALARVVLLLKKHKVPAWAVGTTGLFYAVWFMNACLSVTMIKDTLHAAFLVLFVCHFTEIVRDPAAYYHRKSNLIVLPFVAFFMCATRNNGIHIYLFCFAILLLLRIGQSKKAKAYIGLIVSILLPVFAYKIYSGPVFASLGIAQGEVREALCIPIQQLQRVAVLRADELTEEQTRQMDYYIDNLNWMEGVDGRQYDPFFADPAKSCFYSEHYNNDPVAFWKFYLKTGMQFSKEYVVAFLSNTLGFWYPGYYGFSYVMYDNYAPEVFAVPLERKSILDSRTLQSYYSSVCGADLWRKLPVVRIFFVPGFAAWLLLYALAVQVRKKGFLKKLFPLFLPLIGQFGIMLLSPMSSFRYS